MTTSGCRRFALALARAQAIPLALGVLVPLVVLGALVGDAAITVPGVNLAVPAVRVFPALLAATGAVVAASDWGAYELVGARSVRAIRAGRFVAGALVTLAGGALLGANAQDRQLVVLAVTLYLVLVLGIVLVRRAWWLAVPVLLYGQVFVADVETLRVPPWVLAGLTLVAAPGYLLRAPGGRRDPANLLPE